MAYSSYGARIGCFEVCKVKKERAKSRSVVTSLSSLLFLAATPTQDPTTIEDQHPKKIKFEITKQTHISLSTLLKSRPLTTSPPNQPPPSPSSIPSHPSSSLLFLHLPLLSPPLPFLLPPLPITTSRSSPSSTLLPPSFSLISPSTLRPPSPNLPRPLHHPLLNRRLRRRRRRNRRKTLGMFLLKEFVRAVNGVENVFVRFGAMCEGCLFGFGGGLAGSETSELDEWEGGRARDKRGPASGKGRERLEERRDAKNEKEGWPSQNDSPSRRTQSCPGEVVSGDLGWVNFTKDSDGTR